MQALMFQQFNKKLLMQVMTHQNSGQLTLLIMALINAASMIGRSQRNQANCCGSDDCKNEGWKMRRHDCLQREKAAARTMPIVLNKGCCEKAGTVDNDAPAEKQ